MSLKITEKDLELFNRYLKDWYGTTENLPNFRICWSDDLLEKRWLSHTPEGFVLLNPEVREVRKYSYINEKYVLERLMAVPEFVESDLVNKLSYEPIWVFEDNKGNYLPPRLDAAKFIVENIMMTVQQAGYTKYKDPDSNPEEAKENKDARIRDLQENLFGNETDVTDALAYKEAIVVPANYIKETSK